MFGYLTIFLFIQGEFHGGGGNGGVNVGGLSSARPRSRKKSSFNTPRRREVQLSKISIYIVFMFVICHR